MVDGLYQSLVVFFIPYFLFMQGNFVTENGQDVSDRLRLGAYIAHPAIFAINFYILMNTYQWDWIMLLVITISDLFVFLWTGVYSSFESSVYFYRAGKEIYSEATFWAIFFLVPIICLFPRFAIKSIQKVYFPYDVDIIREQERLGAFDHLKTKTVASGGGATTQETKLVTSESESSGRPKHQHYGSIDEDCRPIYPASTTTRATTQHQHSQNGSDSTNFTVNRMSLDVPLPIRPSMDRARPSYDRIRASMDRVRPSFEASNDFTSAARLSRIESSQSHTGRFRPRLRGLSLTKSANH
jgi:phospholipid-translocating ATPase